jgi:hypothetical protein
MFVRYGVWMLGSKAGYQKTGLPPCPIPPSESFEHITHCPFPSAPLYHSQSRHSTVHNNLRQRENATKQTSNMRPISHFTHTVLHSAVLRYYMHYTLLKQFNYVSGFETWTLQSRRRFQMYQSRRWRQYAPPKCQLCTGPQSVTAHKARPSLPQKRQRLRIW